MEEPCVTITSPVCCGTCAAVAWKMQSCSAFLQSGTTWHDVLLHFHHGAQI